MSVGESSISAYGTLEEVADALLGLTYAGQSSDFSGADTVTLEIADAGGLTASSIVRIDVEAASPPKITRAGPLASLPRTLSVDEDGELFLDALHVSVLSSESETMVQMEISCTNGIISLPLSDREKADLRTTTGTGQGVILAGTADRVNRALRSLVYRPDADFWGSDQLSIVAREGTDGVGGSSGWNTLAGIESIIVLINPVNDPPTIHVPIAFAGDVIPTAFAGEVFGLGGIEVRDADAEEPRGSQLVSVNTSVAVEGTLLSLALGNTTVQGRIPGVGFMEGSAEGVFPIIAFRAPLHLANYALSLLQFLSPYGQPSGLCGVTIIVSDHGNWGNGVEEVVSANLIINLQRQEDPFAASPGGFAHWDTPHGALSVDEDGELSDLGVALVPDSASDASSINGTWVDATLEVEHGFVQVSSSGRWINGKDAVELVRHSPGSLTVSGALAEVSTVLAATTYVPEPDFHGPETLALSAQEHRGDWAMNASVEILVFPQPDPPTISVGSSLKALTAEGGSRLILRGVEVQHVDALDEFESGTVTLRGHSVAGRGTLSVNGTQPGLWMYTEEGGSVLVVRGSVESVQTALDSGTLEYVPADGYDGLDVIMLTIAADSPYGAFGYESLGLVEDFGGNSGGNASVEVEITVLPPFTPAAVTIEGGSVFRGVEGNGIEMPGILVRAPGRRNTSGKSVSIRFEMTQGGVTLPGAANRQVAVRSQGESSLTLTGTEADVNMALRGAVFNGGPFYNGVADIKVTWVAA